MLHWGRSRSNRHTNKTVMMYEKFHSWSGESFQLDLSAVPDKKLKARFHNPGSGQWIDFLSVAGGGIREFNKPDSGDWAFYAVVE